MRVPLPSILTAFSPNPEERRPVLRTAGLLLFALYHSVLFAVGSMNLTANNFVLKGGRFYSDQLFSSDFAARWILLAPLLIPVWIRMGRAFLPPWVRLGRGLFLAALVSLSVNFPFFFVALSGPPPAWMDLLRCMVRDGITQPYAFVFASMALGALIPAARTAGEWSESRWIRWTIVAVVLALLGKLVLAGSALPRLEDETAYHVQALIFQTGRLKGTLASIPGISLDRLSDMVFVPFLIQDGASFFSAHNHGWSFVLALFGSIGLKSYANLVFTLLNVFLVLRIVKLHFGTGEEGLSTRIAMLLLFAGTPILFFLSNTFMAHSLALTVALCILGLHEKLKLSRAGILPFCGFILVVAVGFFVRPQSVAPLLCALLIFNVVQWLRSGGTGERKTHGTRAAVVLVAAGFSFALLMLYSDVFVSGHPVLMSAYAKKYLVEGCQSLGFGPGYGCFPTYGTMGHSFRKALLNIGDIAGRWNQELSPGGIPLLVVGALLAARNFRTLFAGPAFLYLLIVLGSTLEFGLYFHNGGESYRGRYLADCAYALPLLLGFLLQAEGRLSRDAVLRFWKENAPVLVGGILLLFPVLTVFQIRGEYFHPYLAVFPSASSIASHPIENTVISVREMTDAGAVGSDNKAQVQDEFSGQLIEIPGSRVRRYLNLGYGTLLASGTKLTPFGLPADEGGNILVTGATLEESRKISAALGKSPAAVELRFFPFEPVTKTSRFVRFWNRRNPELLQMQ